MNCTVIPEDIDNQGQADLTVILDDNVYVMEIMVVDKAGEAGSQDANDPALTNPALEQIIARDYAAKYRGQPGRQVFELGLVFGKAEKTLVQFAWRQVSGESRP